MLVIAGWVVVTVAVFGSLVLGGGHVLALLQPFEFTCIFGAAIALLYELLQKARMEGLLALEADVNDPESSPIYNKYPTGRGKSSTPTSSPR